MVMCRKKVIFMIRKSAEWRPEHLRQIPVGFGKVLIVVPIFLFNDNLTPGSAPDRAAEAAADHYVIIVMFRSHMTGKMGGFCECVQISFFGDENSSFDETRRETEV